MDRKKLEIPQTIIEGKIYLETKKELKAGTGEYLNKKRILIYFDEIQNILCIGNSNTTKNNINVKISSNLIISLNEKKIKAIWIIPVKIK